MKQHTLTGFEKYGKTTRRAKFLADMDRIIPWPEMTTAVATVYPKISEQGGRPPIPLERMLRIYFLQLWFNLSDPAVEEELYDSAAMRGFADGGNPRPSATRQGLHQPKVPWQRMGQRAREGEEPDQIARACQGRAHHRGDQARVRLPEGALPRTRQEPAPSGGYGCTGQPLHGAAAVAGCVGDVSPQNGIPRGSARQTLNRRPKHHRNSLATQNLCR